jgi:hypothetical protein
MCKTEKPYQEFKKNQLKFSGYASYCLQCHRERAARKREKKRDKKLFNSQDTLNNLFSLWNSSRGNHG